MKRAFWILPGVAALVVFGTTFGYEAARGPERSRAASTVVAVLAPTQEVLGQGSFEVRIHDVTDLAGYAFLINFDPSVIQVKSQTPGNFPAGCNVQVEVVDNTDGQIDFACITAPLSGEDAVDEPLMTVDFNCGSGGGDTTIDLKFVELADGLAQPIPQSVQDGELDCRHSDAPTSTLLGDVDCNGTIDPIDALLVLQFEAALVDSLACQHNGDTSEDGTISSLDAVLILQFIAGLTPWLP